ncbi:hypothetical protein M408DRAFT_12433 [Serendipita vermifera MAFF 305830]|uniref:DNA topoisomerase n=1 Tax=Serendipita vermifera MAFF 305830 TaxID=933852 RepID=A0A0C3AR54_SERVB|nr:hypothetical protein M408DRAFT_12433 [Serendipita vermifera MAFF 305830]
MRVLCVAEKPSIARSITDILSGGRFDTVEHVRFGRTSNYHFDYPQTNESFVVTYVAGHITEVDFPDTHRKWNSCDPFALFDASVEVKHPERVNELVRNLQTQARSVDSLMIWTDCDREGEHIGYEIAQVCRKTADALYQRGILSYPRTETDQFDDQFDFRAYIQKQTSSPDWGAFATRLQGGEFSKPRKGKKNDKAHPPIHPTAYAGNLTGNEKKVYEYVTRRFLASCSKDAEGFQTTITVNVNNEEFSANALLTAVLLIIGLLVLERNYLEVFPYDNWTSHELPNFEEGEEFMPSVCELREGQTTRPNLLTEADLVGLMDKNGIGTDATIAQHIHTIVQREYVMEKLEGSTKYLVPSTLGVGLVHGYNQIGLEKSLSKPQLRREVPCVLTLFHFRLIDSYPQTERSMVQVCNRNKTKDGMLEESIEQYKEVFILARREFERVVESVRYYVQGDGQPRGDGPNGGNQRRPGAGQRPRRNAPNRGPSPSDSEGDDDGRPPPAGGAIRAQAPARAQPARASRDNVSSVTPCNCGVPAVERVSNTETTRGRKFWRCGSKDKDCEFFQWVDTPANRQVAGPSRPSNSGNGRTGREDDSGYGGSGWSDGGKTIPAKRRSDIFEDDGPARKCSCNQDAIKRTVVKEGPNKGRKFWKCANPEESQCKFFEWDDQPQATSAPSFGNSSRQASTQEPRTAAVTGECYKCHQPGTTLILCLQRALMPVPEAHRGKEKERMTVATNAARKVTGQVVWLHVRTLNQWVEMHQTSGQGSRPKLKIQNTVMHTPQAVGVVAMAAEINASNVEKLDTSPTIAPMLLVRRLSEKVEVAAVAEEGLEVHNEGVHGSSEAGFQKAMHMKHIEEHRPGRIPRGPSALGINPRV